MNKQTSTKTRRKSRRPLCAEQQRASLDKAVTGVSMANYDAIFNGFEAMGIPMDEIKPRENVFTFNAWKALGRVVCKGQHGVKVVTVVEYMATDEDSGEKVKRTRPTSTTVFHITQTDPLN